MTITFTNPPTLPSLSDPANFNDRALSLFSWLTGTFIPELEAVEGLIPDGGDFAVDGDTLYVDVSANNVGIGTDDPSERLDVTASQARFLVTNNTGGGRRFLFANDTTDPGAFLTNKEEMIQIVGQDGNVNRAPGISLIATQVGGVGIMNRFEFNASRSTKAQLSADTYNALQSGDELGSLIWSGDDGTDLRTNAAVIGAIVEGTVSTNSIPARLVFETSGSEAMRIDSSGNVGIGTTSPGSKLSIVGLPTSASGLSAGDVWNDSGTLKIVT